VPTDSSGASSIGSPVIAGHFAPSPQACKFFLHFLIFLCKKIQFNGNLYSPGQVMRNPNDSPSFSSGSSSSSGSTPIGMLRACEFFYKIDIFHPKNVFFFYIAFSSQPRSATESGLLSIRPDSWPDTLCKKCFLQNHPKNTTHLNIWCITLSQYENFTKKKYSF